MKKKILLAMFLVIATISIINPAPFMKPTAFFTMKIVEHEQLSWVRKTIGELINTIFTEEFFDARALLGVNKQSQSVSIVGFIPKLSQNISIVYLNESAKRLDEIAMAVEQKISDKNFAAFSSSLSDQGALFGYKKNEIVIKVVDDGECLNLLRALVTAALSPDVINNFFPFVPHIALGKLNDVAVENFVAISSGIAIDHEVIVRMMDRIRDRVVALIEKLPISNNFSTSFRLDSVDLYDFNRALVKKIWLKRTFV